MKRLIDLSQIIENGMPVYPGDTPSKLTQVKRFEIDGYNNFKLETCMHAGTHIDGHGHLTENSGLISEANLGAFISEGCLIDARDKQVIKSMPEYSTKIKTDSIVLLLTGMNRLYGSESYYTSHPQIESSFCDLLVEKKVKVLGMDMPSPDNPPFDIHKRLLNNGIFIIENLTNLEELLNINRFEVIAFPLKIKADSSIARVVARVF